MNYFTGVWEDFKNYRHLELYFGFLCALVITGLHLFHVVSSDVVNGCILAVLALIAVSLLKNRRENLAIINLISSISSKKNENGLFFEFKDYSRDEVARRVEECHDYFLFAVKSGRTLPVIDTALLNALQRNAHVRILFAKKDSSAIKMAAFRSTKERNYKDIERALWVSLNRLANIASRLNNPELIEVKWIDYLPPFSINAFNLDSSDGVVQLRLLPFRIPNDKRPVCEIDNRTSPGAFMHIKSQIDTLWNEGEVVDLQRYLNK